VVGDGGVSPSGWVGKWKRNGDTESKNDRMQKTCCRICLSNLIVAEAHEEAMVRQINKDFYEITTKAADPGT